MANLLDCVWIVYSGRFNFFIRAVFPARVLRIQSCILHLDVLPKNWWSLSHLRKSIEETPIKNERVDRLSEDYQMIAHLNYDQ